MNYWGSFIAIEPENRIKQQLLVETQKKLGIEKIAWHSFNYLHITLFFLGWINTKEADTINLILSKYKNKITSCKLTGRILQLGWNNKKEYIVLEIKKERELLELHDEIKKKLLEKNITFKEQEFLPHISLGRIPDFEVFCTQNSIFRETKIEVLGLNLYESYDLSKIITK